MIQYLFQENYMELPGGCLHKYPHEALLSASWRGHALLRHGAPLAMCLIHSGGFSIPAGLDFSNGLGLISRPCGQLWAPEAEGTENLDDFWQVQCFMEQCLIVGAKKWHGYHGCWGSVDFGFLAKSSLQFCSFSSHTNAHFEECSKVSLFLPLTLSVRFYFGTIQIKWHFLASSKIVGISFEGMVLGRLTEIGRYNDLWLKPAAVW